MLLSTIEVGRVNGALPLSLHSNFICDLSVEVCHILMVIGIISAHSSNGH